MFVCVCEHINEATLRQLIEEGHDTLDKLEKVAKVGMRCKICIPEVKRILNEYR